MTEPVEEYKRKVCSDRFGLPWEVHKTVVATQENWIKMKS